MAKTGRRIKRSVNCTGRWRAVRCGGEKGGRGWSVVGRRGFGRVGRLHAVVYGDRGIGAEFEDAGADNFLASLQPLKHADLVAAGRAQFDDAGFDGLDGGALGVLSLLEDEDRVAVGGVLDSGGWDDQRVFLDGEGNFDGDKHSRAEGVVGVGEGALDGEGARGFVHPGVERGDGSRPDSVRTGRRGILEGDAQGAAADGPRGLLLGEGEADADGVHGMHGGDGASGVEVLAEAGLADAHDPVEGGADAFALEEGGGLLALGTGLEEFVLGGVDFGGGDGVFSAQVALALDFEAGEGEAGVGGFELGFFLVGLELDEEGAFLDGLSGVKGDFGDDAGEVGADGAPVHGVQGPDHADAGGPRLAFDAHGGHGGRGWGEGFGHGHARFDLAFFQVGNSCHCTGDAQKHDEHSFPHRGGCFCGRGVSRGRVWAGEGGVCFVSCCIRATFESGRIFVKFLQFRVCSWLGSCCFCKA